MMIWFVARTRISHIWSRCDVVVRGWWRRWKQRVTLDATSLHVRGVIVSIAACRARASLLVDRRHSRVLGRRFVQGTVARKTQFILGKVFIGMQLSITIGKAPSMLQLLVDVIVWPVWVGARGRADKKWGRSRHRKTTRIMQSFRMKHL